MQPLMVNKKIKADHYFRLVLFTSLGISLSIIFISIVFYISYSGIAKDQVVTHIESDLHQLEDYVTQMNQSARKLCLSISSDGLLEFFMLNVKPSNQALLAGFGQLENHRFISEHTHSIYIYNRITNTIYLATEAAADYMYDRESFFDSRVIDGVERNEFQRFQQPVPRWLKEDGEGDDDVVQAYTYIYTDSFNDDRFNISVVLNMSLEGIYREIKEFSEVLNNDILIMDSSGTLVVDSSLGLLGSDISGLPFITEILEGDNAGGIMEKAIDGRDTLIVYSRKDENGWRYISVCPYEEVVFRLEKVRNQAILICMSVLGTGLALSLYISRKLYKPVQYMAKALSRLREEERERYPMVRQQLLRDAVRGSRYETRSKIQAHHRKYKINFDKGTGVRLILLKLRNYGKLSEIYDIHDRRLIRYSVSNIASEIIGGQCECEAVDMEGDHVVLLCYLDNSKPKHNYDEFDEALQSIQHHVADYFSVDLSIVVSSEAETASEITDLYTRARADSFYMKRDCDSTFIHSDVLRERNESGFVYPDQEEKQLKEAIMLGDVASARSIYAGMEKLLSQYSYVDTDLAFSHLIYELKVTIENLYRNHFAEGYLYENETIIIQNYESSDEISDYLFGKLEKIVMMIYDKRDNKACGIVEDINKIIYDRFGDQDLSLDMIAESIGYTSKYISKVYRSVTTQTINEVILQRRIAESKRLLSETDLLVGEISAKTGFSSDSYFYKVFRRVNGITPSEFRRL